MAINVNVGANTGPLDRDVRKAIERINKSGALKIRLDDKGVTQPLGNMRRSADEFTKSLEASNARVLAFGASVGIINGITDAFKGLVKATMEVQKNLTDINVVMNLSNQQLDKFGGGLFKVAAETGAGFQEASKAATEFARQGLTVNETLKRTKDALILTRLTGMDAADSVKSLTAAMNTFGHQVENSTQLVSKFAAVDVKFAVSAKDFAEAIARAGQSAKSAGVDLDSFVGMVTAVQEKTARGGAVIGNAFKTIFTRTQRPATLKAMEDLGVQVRSLNGEVFSADKILLNLSKRWDTLTTAQKANVGQTTAGMFQINLLKAALEDMSSSNSRWSQAMQISSAATDESNKKNEQLRATMSALATETGVAVQQLAQTIGDLALAPGISKVLDSLKGITDWLNNTLGGGEEKGNSLAKGLVSGMGNYLSGPGLVMIAAVMGKLFVNAVKYGATSLASLLNINKAAEKRKIIEQNVLQLIAQNSKISKEMLGTKLSQEKKESIILNLIRQQTVEAAKLQAISRSMVGPLIGAGITKNMSLKYSGHVPNFADPEQANARSAGYSPGGVRQKNIPGAGRVTYNSAETVKNFAGFSQPAIMPPKGSRAGANYQQAFAGAHGFDPYASRGFVPNFNIGAWTTGRSNTWSPKGERNPYSSVYDKRKGMTGNSASYLDLNKLLGEPFMKTMGVMTGQGAQKAHVVDYTQTLASVPELRSRLVKGLGGNAKQRAEADALAKNTRVRAGLTTRGVYPVDRNDAKQLAGNTWANTIRNSPGMKKAAKDLSITVRNKVFGKDAGEVQGKPGEALGHLLSEPAWQGYMLEASVKGAMGQSIDSGAESQRAFDIDGNTQPLKEFMGLDTLQAIELKNSEGAGKGASGGVANKVMNRIFQKNKQGVLQAQFEKQRNLVPLAAGAGAPKGIRNALGFVPNFAQDGLTESISREKTAMRGRGLPVSAVRIGQSDKLQTKGNPAGLGVTNTVDEPNGLRDVLASAGFVPNFVFKHADFNGGKAPGGPSMAHKANLQLKALVRRYESGTRSMAELEKGIKNLSLNTKDQSKTAKRVTDETRASLAPIGRLNKARKAATRALRQSSARRRMSDREGGFGARAPGASQGVMGRLGRFQSGTSGGRMGHLSRGITGMPGMMGGMALTMGAGMLSETMDPEGTDEYVQGGAGAMTGVATGAMMGAMLGPLGAVVGGLVGGFIGFQSGVSKAEAAIDALRESAKQSQQALEKMAIALALSDESLGDKFDKGYDMPVGLNFKTNEQAMDFVVDQMTSVTGSNAAAREGRKDGKKVMAQFFDNNEDKQFKFKKYNHLTKTLEEERKSGKEVAEELRSGKGTLLYDDMAGQVESVRDSLKDKRSEAIESMQKRINIQRAIIKSEDLFLRKKHSLDMAFTASQSDIQEQLKLYSGALNESAKFEIAHNLKLDKQRKKFSDEMDEANESYKKGLLKFLQTDDKSGLAQELKNLINNADRAEATRALGADASDFFKKVDANNVDGAIAGLTADKLRELQDWLNQSVLGNAEVASSLKAQADVYQHNLLKIKQSNSLTSKRIELEGGVNRQLKERMDIMTRTETLNSEALRKSKLKLSAINETRKISTLRDQISLASVGGGTAEEKFSVGKKQRKMALAEALRKNEHDASSAMLRQAKSLNAYKKMNPADAADTEEGLLKRPHFSEQARFLKKKARAVLFRDGSRETGWEGGSVKDFTSRKDLIRPPAPDLDSLDPWASQHAVDASRKEYSAHMEETLKSKHPDITAIKVPENFGKETLRAMEERAKAIEEAEEIKQQVASLTRRPPLPTVPTLPATSSDISALTKKVDEAKEKDRQIIKRAGSTTDKEILQLENLSDSLDGVNDKHKLINDSLIKQYELQERLAQVQHDFKYGADAFGNGMNVAFREASERAALFKHELGKAIPQAFSQSMSGAMMKLIREGGKFGDYLMDGAIGFLDTINQKFMDHWMDKLMGSLGVGADIPPETLQINDANMKLNGFSGEVITATGSLARFNEILNSINSNPTQDGRWTPPLPDGTQGTKGVEGAKGSEGSSFGSEFWNGFKGFFGFNKGGQVPTMLTNGEYVMNRRAVGKMGTAGMDALNKGVVPGRHKGGPAPGSNEAWSSAFGAEWDARSGKQNSHVSKYYKRLAEQKKGPSLADVFSQPINKSGGDYAPKGTSLASMFSQPINKSGGDYAPKGTSLASMFSQSVSKSGGDYAPKGTSLASMFSQSVSKSKPTPSFYGGKRGAAGKLPKRFQEKLKRLKAGSPSLGDLFKMGVPFDRKSGGGAAGTMAAGIGSAGMQYLMGRKRSKDAEKESQYEERPDDYFQKNAAYKNYKMSASFMQQDRRVGDEVSKHGEKKEEELQRWIEKKNQQQALGRQVVSAVGNFAMSKLGDSLGSKDGLFSKGTGKTGSDGKEIRQSAFGRADDALGYKTMGYKMESWGLNKQQARLNKQQSSFGQSDLSGGDYQAKWDQYYSNEGLLNSNQGRLDELSTLQNNAPRNMWQKTGSWARGDGYKNAGGKISGPAGIDTIPAMLTEGEYVINANAAKKIGMPTLERINAGKFNEGGLVGDKTGEVPSSSGSNTNNISITVNVKGDGESSSESKGDGKESKNETMDKLSQRIKQQVVTIIREENRPGGLLGS
jgi:TP901 family phage tail tape measure protein